MRKYLLLFCLSLPFMSYADVNPTKPNGLPNASYPDLRPTIDRHIAKVDGMRAGLKTMELEIKAYRGSADVTAKRNYPIVPYDPNHPNVKKQAKNFKLPVKAGTIAKNLGRGLNAAALGLAVYDLLGAGVDYVLDPDNNRLRYRSSDGYVWQSLVGNYGFHSSKDLAAQYNCSLAHFCVSVKNLKPLGDDGSSFEVIGSTIEGNEVSSYVIVRKKSDSYSDISLDKVATKVIEQAEQGNPDAQDAVRTAVLDDLSSGAYDDLIRQLGSDEEGWELTDPTADTDSSTDTGTSDNPSDSTDPKPDGSLPDDGSESESDSDTKDENKPDDEKSAFELPAFCEWASAVCDYIDWVKEQYELPDLQDEKVTIENVNIDWEDKATKTYISFSGQCPAPVSIPVTFMGARQDMTLSYEPFCRFAGMIKPAVILGAWISALLIVVGGRAKGE